MSAFEPVRTLAAWSVSGPFGHSTGEWGCGRGGARPRNGCSVKRSLKKPPLVDRLAEFHHFIAMLRLLFTLLLSLSLVSAPAAAQTQSVADCGMSAPEMDMSDEHEQMPCCTPDCMASSAAAVFDESAAATNELGHSGALIIPLRDFALHSISPSAADPPPRPSFA